MANKPGAQNSYRTTVEVFEDHLEKRRDWRVEEDIAENFAENIVIITRDGIFIGHDGIRQNAHLLYQQLPKATFEYTTRLTEGDVAFLEWKGHANGTHVCDGADTFVIQQGKIVVQTIHYTVNSSHIA